MKLPANAYYNGNGLPVNGTAHRASMSPSISLPTRDHSPAGSLWLSPAGRLGWRQAKAIEPLVARRIPAWKTAIDCLLVLVALTLLSPVLLLIAVLIKSVSRGPLFFKQTRIGYLGKPFTIWKFRTMHLNAETSSHQQHLQQLINSDKPMQKLDAKNDPRIIPLGTLLRKSGLDEVPQLFNVLRGEMSVIGPRPCLPYEAEKFAGWQRRRFDTLPGLTGLWQVSGKNRTTFKEMIRLDITYVRNLSPVLDGKILLRTIPAIIEQLKSR